MGAMQNSLATLSTNPSLYFATDSLLRILLVIVLLGLGFWVAKRTTKVLRKSLNALLERDFVAQSPLGMLMDSTDALRGSGLFSHSVFWVIVFIFVAIAGELLGITFFSNIVTLVLRFLPMLISASIVFVFGLIFSGVAENVVKRQLKQTLPQQAVLLGTATSYIVLTLFSLIALSELGVASEFILVLFSGFIFALALAVGISIGFGSKGIVEETLQGMIQDEKKRRTSRKEK